VGDEEIIAAAVKLSPLAQLPAETQAALLEGSTLLELPAGAVPQRQGSRTPRVSLIVSGLLRVFHTSADGRTITLRYARAGGLMAVAALYLKQHGNVGQEALTDCRVLALQTNTLLEISRRDVQVANLFAEEVSYRMLAFLDELAGNTFGTMRQRVVRHLLDLAAGPATGPRKKWIARISQQELADAVGSVREVVVRQLRELREEGLLRTGRDEIELLDPERLHSETFPRSEQYRP
jgi:CRP/FNR family cyclic AMP-dependent transcriptional regulator